ncbi:MAG: DinB family protein [Planctomycetota bacterium]
MTGPRLALGFTISNGAVEQNLAGVDDDLARRAPKGGGSTVAWIVGHIVNSRVEILKLLGRTSSIPAADLAPYGRGSDGRAVDSFLPLAAMREHLATSRNELAAALSDATDDELARPFQHDRLPLSMAKDTAAVVTILLFHEGYHAGQLGSARRALGLGSAIP